jgi:hypothetical protein
LAHSLQDGIHSLVILKLLGTYLKHLL